ncbi:LOB domain-containing protein 25-like [Apium graveolens]|uniref:LOB domain-containing protein 25-like n=1 Tax=Apium graveolens TaxID=4045 RepID=UPI003D7AA4B4
MASPSYANSPCAACKFLRRKCISGCIFAPYFPPEEPQKFAYVHKIFGASNVSKLLLEIPPHQREDAVNSLAYEADARIKDPVYGCVGAISVLQQQVIRLQKELDATNASLLRYTTNTDSTAGITMSSHSAVLSSRQVSSSQDNYCFSHSDAIAGVSLPYNCPFTFNRDPGDTNEGDRNT